MNIHSNISRTILVIDLQQKFVGIHTHESLFSTKSAANYKDIVFPHGEILNATIKDSA